MSPQSPIEEELEQLAVAENAALLQKAQDFEAFFKQPVYHRVVAWLESRADESLSRMRGNYMVADDRIIANLVRQWADREACLQDFQTMIQDAIHEKRRFADAMASIEENYLVDIRPEH
jgi:hypothetical protein